MVGYTVLAEVPHIPRYGTRCSLDCSSGCPKSVKAGKRELRMGWSDDRPKRFRQTACLDTQWVTGPFTVSSKGLKLLRPCRQAAWAYS